MYRPWVLIFLIMTLWAGAEEAAVNPPSPAPSSLQTLVDARPGQMIAVDGEYVLDQALEISTPGSGLYGSGRIIQNNPESSIIVIRNTQNIRLDGLTLSRPDGRQDTEQYAVLAENCQDLKIDDVRVIDNRGNHGAIRLERCRNSRIRGCEIINYKRIAVDDRTENPLYGYAFRVIDGTGICVSEGQNIQILGNRILENHLMPDATTKEAFRLGEFTDGKQPSQPGRLAPKGTYANNWHQGSAIIVTAPEKTWNVLIADNLIENAAQGIDIHADQVTCSRNIIDHAFIGIKCMHGSRNVIISENNIANIDLWGLEMQAGSASHPALPPENGAPAHEANATRGNIIANNIFSGFGRGNEYYNWASAKGGVINLETGPLPENPVLADVLIHGNIVYDSNRDLPPGENGTTTPPNYAYAVCVSTNPPPEGLHFSGNILHPGREGISNVPLEP